MRNNVLWFNPCLPDELLQLRMRIRYREHLLVETTPDKLKSSAANRVAPIQIGCRGEVRELKSEDRGIRTGSDDPLTFPPNRTAPEVTSEYAGAVLHFSECGRD
ncbi:MAG: hypothetical protein R3F37_05090 [Candidatus Competibacteraceae bacterium]